MPVAPLGAASGYGASNSTSNPGSSTGHQRSGGAGACDAEIARYRSWIEPLGWIGQVAPLLGLLGTVLGMVELFTAMDVAGGAVDASMLASGIWKALLTTAAGLIIAIPTLGAHLWLTRRLEALDVALDEGAGLVLDHLLGARP